jgi:hypothetical protein
MLETNEKFGYGWNLLRKLLKHYYTPPHVMVDELEKE